MGWYSSLLYGILSLLKFASCKFCCKSFVHFWSNGKFNYILCYEWQNFNDILLLQVPGILVLVFRFVVDNGEDTADILHYIFLSIPTYGYVKICCHNNFSMKRVLVTGHYWIMARKDNIIVNNHLLVHNLMELSCIVCICCQYHSLSAAISDLVFNENLRATCQRLQLSREYVLHREWWMIVWSFMCFDYLLGFVSTLLQTSILWTISFLWRDQALEWFSSICFLRV